MGDGEKMKLSLECFYAFEIITIIHVNLIFTIHPVIRRGLDFEASKCMHCTLYTHSL